MERKVLINTFLSRAIMTLFLTLFACFTTVSADEVTIGDGGTNSSSSFPTNSYYNYSLTQQIYTAAELGKAGYLESIAFYSSKSSTRNLDIYMVHTDKSSFSSGTDWVSVTADDLVFSGDVSFAADAWITTIVTNLEDDDPPITGGGGGTGPGRAPHVNVWYSEDDF